MVKYVKKKFIIIEKKMYLYVCILKFFKICYNYFNYFICILIFILENFLMV